MNYYDEKEKTREGATRTCWYMILAIIVALIIAGIFSGCRTKKFTENTETRDSIRTEIIEKIVIDTVKVIVEVPAETKERETRDSTSTLETSFAISTASLIWRDGLPWLFHSLENKPQKIEKPVEVAHKDKTKIVYRTRYVSKTKIVAEELPWWKEALMWVGAVMLAAVIIFIIVWLVRRFR